MNDIERRFLIATDLRVAAGGDAAAPTTLTGYAAVFEQLSEDLGGFRERIAPGAFAASLATHDQRALWNHDPGLVLARRGSGTLRLREDAHGLAVEIDLPDTSAGRDAGVSIARGDVTQMSFGFVGSTVRDNFEKIDGEWIRTLLAVDLVEVSPVAFPAYPQTSVGARSLDALRAAQAAALADERPPLPPSQDLYALRARLQIARARIT